MSLYHGFKKNTSSLAKKSMIFTEYCQKRAAQISLLNENFEKAWLFALIFKFNLAADKNMAFSNCKVLTAFIT